MEIDIAVEAPAENPIFSDWQTAITRFLTYAKPVACAHCGELSTQHWTQLKFFRVMEVAGMRLKKSEKEYAPLTPVCIEHILAELDA